MCKLRVWTALLIVLLFLFSCKKEGKVTAALNAPLPVTPVEGNGSVVFDFDAFVDSKPMQDSTWYVNFNSDSFTVTRFNYYLSNVRLKRADGTSFTEPDSYHLIKYFESKRSFSIANVPAGTYTGIEFIIGVDSAKTVAGAHTGDLDIEENMFWDWNTGYVFFKLEGERKTSVYPEANTYSFHVGGYSGANNCLQKCVFNLQNALVSNGGKISKVHYKVQIQEVFKNPNDLDFETVYNGGSRILKVLSDNYKDMFEVDHIEN